MILLLLALQDTSAGATRPAFLDITFDLAKTVPASAASGDIVIKGRRLDLRLPPLPEVRDDLIPKAQTRLLGGMASISIEPTTLLGGVSSTRIMLKWKLAF